MSLGLGIAFSKKQDIELKIAVISYTETMGNPGDSNSRIMNFLNRFRVKDTVRKNEVQNYRFEIPNEKKGKTTESILKVL
ncbi:MAG: hypothetical protein FJY07_04325 [Bacteroidetes bacterium]|nr:hypothetical protein [Bacteroidota bacterium]